MFIQDGPLLLDSHDKNAAHFAEISAKENKGSAKKIRPSDNVRNSRPKVGTILAIQIIESINQRRSRFMKAQSSISSKKTGDQGSCSPNTRSWKSSH